MTEQNTRRGIATMIVCTFLFAVQDVLSRHLAGNYNVLMVVMIRYWLFGLFVIAFAATRGGGLRAAVRTRYPLLQLLRGLLLATQLCIIVLAFVLLGVIETQAVAISYPLIIAALSGVVLGEKPGWRRWLACAIGFLGVLIILRPGIRVLSPEALIPLACAVMFAVYGLLTRYVARGDSTAVSFFWTGIVGVVVTTAVGITRWEPMTPVDSAWMALLCVIGVLSHYMMIRAYELAEASAIQPFAYLQLVFVGILGTLILGEVIDAPTAIGAVVVVLAGLLALWPARWAPRRAAAESAGGSGA